MDLPGIVLPSICCLFLMQVQCGPTLEHEKEHDRVLHGKPLSGKEHHDDLDHDYDHEAFLGEDQAAEFDELSPEESQRRLGVIVDRIDENADGIVSQDELAKWIKFTQTRYVNDDVERQWTSHKPDGKDTISWEEYRQNVYGFLDEEDAEEEEHGFSYKQMEARDQRRWSMADLDHSGELDIQEFAAFLHPEDAEHMRDIVVQETLEDIDKDGDGHVNIDEYIGDMYRDEGGEEGEHEPDWVASEREQFTQFRDTDGNGLMDLEEVKAWIIPPDFDHSEAEAKHLVFESDVDGDGHLTKEEILEKYDLFVGSQATDFGEALSRHDEF